MNFELTLGIELDRDLLAVLSATEAAVFVREEFDVRRTIKSLAEGDS